MLSHSGVGRGPRSAVIAGFATLVVACGGAEPAREQPRGVIFVLLDTVRADRLSAYGYGRDTSPNLERLAHEGALFREVQAPAPWTIPSIATLWSGVLPARHGAGSIGEDDGLRRFAGPESFRGIHASVPTLPVELSEQGYATYGRVANELLAGEWFERGFDELEIAPGSAVDVGQWVEERMPHFAQAPFFLYLHFMDAHVLVRPPREYLTKYLSPEQAQQASRDMPAFKKSVRAWDVFEDPAYVGSPELARYAELRGAAYDGALRYLDDELGRILELFEDAALLDDVLVVVTSDHGEELWDHAELELDAYRGAGRKIGCGHGHTLFQELLRVPLVLRGPGIPPRTVVDRRVSWMDLGATVLDLASGGERRELGDAQSLLPVLSGAKSSSPLFSESLCHGYEQKSLVDDQGYKLIAPTNAGERALLFDLAADTREERDILSREPEIAARLERAIDELSASLRARAFATGEPGSDIAADRLRELGYTESEDP